MENEGDWRERLELIYAKARIDKMKEQEQKILWLYFFEDLTLKQVKAQIGKSESTIHRIIRELCKELRVDIDRILLVNMHLDLLYAPPLRHVTCCCINRFQSTSRIDLLL
jgi:Sigma-70, region 4